jgi:hypothetical protein
MRAMRHLYNKATAVDPSNVRALPLVFIVLALAVRLAPEEWAGDDQTRRLSSLRMYWSCELTLRLHPVYVLADTPSPAEYPHRHSCATRVHRVGRDSSSGTCGVSPLLLDEIARVRPTRPD